ncbi:MAG: ABC transporter substrate-binding protein [Thermanaeromonas sp.]|uniref:ABC transporter substrate-binding protein n=1 Tax=Thermanaeromonas sp. TaxID=2003697 RepID=UPI002439D5D9|nr:ABC transporter substrate-binding protein [Thermanaeromonas sp.]MCG0279004.1 ABC transporter substrate-binding protein [Thermanaeromonas sp.]
MREKIAFILVLTLIAGLAPFQGCASQNVKEGEGRVPLSVAVEYTVHAAPFYVAKEKGWFEENQLEVKSFNVYATGVALASALTKGGIDLAYICLVPALTAYANGGVPLKIVAGTHKNGYGLVVNTSKIKEFKDLEKEEVKIATMQPGATTDLLFNLLIKQKGLDQEKVLSHTVRMNPAKQLLALRSGKVDAIFAPEHFATLAAQLSGMKILAKSQDIWPNMQGSVLIVTDNFLKEHPGAVKKLISLNKRATEFINSHGEETANIVAQSLNQYQNTVKEEMSSPEADISVTPVVVKESMSNLDYSPDLDAQEIQKIIDLMYSYGYLKKQIKAEEVLYSD